MSADVQAWYASLSPRDTDRVNRLIVLLRQSGPNLRRPYADHVKGSRHNNLKELRSRGTGVRILFAFDPDGVAQLLVGGDKRGQWNRWYPTAIRRADRLFDNHLDKGRREGRWPPQSRVMPRTLSPRSR